MKKHLSDNIEESNTIEYDKVSCRCGLSNDQVEKLKKRGCKNVIREKDPNSIGRIVRENIFTYFNLIFFVFAFLLMWQRSYNHMAFMGVVFSNTAIGIFQGIRSKKELDKLKIISEPQTRVIRNSEIKTVQSDELVLGDIIVLESGDKIPADSIIAEGSVMVNEAQVSGEEDEVKKECNGVILSGSFIVSGRCFARIIRVGNDSFAAKLAAEAKKAKKAKRPGMMRSLTVLITVIGIIIVPFSAVMFSNQHFVLGLSVKESVENSIASAIGMIPEGLYLLTSIALAASTVRLAKKNTLVHDMKCIESLARVDVICVDKTGTITSPHMSVERIETVSENADIAVLKEFVSIMETKNDTINAIENKLKEEKSERLKLVRKKEFSSLYKYSGAEFEKKGIFVMGAPDIILSDEDGIRNKISKYTENGERVIVFGEGKESLFSGEKKGVCKRPLFIMVLSNPIRENAKETFDYFEKNGVGIKVISGDNPVAVSKIARKSGIKDADKYVDLSNMAESELCADVVLKYTVFGRVDPYQKRKIIRILKETGKTVAMTGDGVNDVLALKDADCSIAMATGTQAAASVSDMVLVNSDFANMPDVVNEGRRVINNIERTASLFLVKNIFSFFMTLISLITVSYYPLKPVQISIASCMMIGIPSFFLALSPNKEKVKGKFLRNVLNKAFPVGLAAVFAVWFCMIMTGQFGIGREEASTAAGFIYTAAAFIMLIKVCRPVNFIKAVLCGAMLSMYFGAVVLFPKFFGFVKLNAGETVLTLILIIFMYFLQDIIEKLKNTKLF